MYRKWSYTIKRLLKKQKDGKLVGLTCIDSLRTAHGSSFSAGTLSHVLTEKQVNNRSFAAYTDQRVIQAYQANGAALKNMDKSLQMLFIRLKMGHLLSECNETFYGLLFHLIWNVQQTAVSSQIR